MSDVSNGWISWNASTGVSTDTTITYVGYDDSIVSAWDNLPPKKADDPVAWLRGRVEEMCWKEAA